MGAAILIETGWPAPDLSPNARPHFYAKAKAKKVARREAFYSACLAGARNWKPKAERFKLTIHAHPDRVRARDADNLVASAKAHIDGIADALGTNDSSFDAPAVIWHDKDKRARLVFQIEPA